MGLGVRVGLGLGVRLRLRFRLDADLVAGGGVGEDVVAHGVRHLAIELDLPRGDRRVCGEYRCGEGVWKGVTVVGCAGRVCGEGVGRGCGERTISALARAPTPVPAPA